MEHLTAVEANKTTLDIRARRFWIRGQQAFLDVRVFDPNACCYLNAPLSQCYTTIEKEKSVTITNALYKSNKEPLAILCFQFILVWVENVKLSTQD